MKKTLITGATGQLGSIVVNHLLKSVEVSQITILARNEAKTAEFKTKGITVKIGDYHDPASLENALDGIENLLLISASDFNDRLGQHKNVVNAAKKTGVKHIFYTGITMKNIEQSPLKPLLESHYQTEDYIKSLGFTYTFFQNGLYADIIPLFAGGEAVNNGIYFPAGEGKVAFAVRKDLGEAIANVLASKNHENKSYALTSSSSYSFADVASILSKLSGKIVKYYSPDGKVFEETLRQNGLPEEIIKMSIFFAAGIKNNEFDTPDNSLELLLGRNLTSLETYLEEAYNL